MLRELVRSLSFLSWLFLFAGCSYLPFSGGKLSGKIAPYPENWETIVERPIVQLETNPSDPYSVNLWVVDIENHPYVYAGDNYATWAKNIESDRRVLLKSGDSVYELNAQRVLDAEFFKKFASAWEKKYGNRPRNENYDETYLFQLSERELEML